MIDSGFESVRFERWRDFAIRMAKVCYASNRRPSGSWILSVVEDFFDHELDETYIPCIVNWDHCIEYPEGNPMRRREYHKTYCGCDGYRHEHDNQPNPECPECHGSGVHHAWARPHAVCDRFTEFMDYYRGYPPRCKSCKAHNWDEECRCDEIEERYYDQWDNQWAAPVHCCIRAGLDCAFEPSMGVLGFTAGDIRRMYPEGVPDWVKGDEPWDTVPIKGVILGVGFVPCDPVPNGTFDELSDEASIWI